MLGGCSLPEDSADVFGILRAARNHQHLELVKLGDITYHDVDELKSFFSGFAKRVSITVRPRQPHPEGLFESLLGSRLRELAIQFGEPPSMVEFRHLAEYLRETPFLINLRFAFQSISRPALAVVLSGLESNNSVRKLELYTIGRTDHSSGDLTRNILRRNQTLEDVKICLGSVCNSVIIEDLRRNTSVKRIHFAGEIDVEALVQVVVDRGLPIELHLIDGCVDDDGLRAFCGLLEQSELLRGLSLCEDGFSGSQMAQIFRTLAGAHGLKVLSLWLISLERVGFEALIATMGAWVGVEKMDMYWNENIGDGCLSQLLAALESNTSLISFQLARDGGSIQGVARQRIEMNNLRNRTNRDMRALQSMGEWHLKAFSSFTIDRLSRCDNQVVGLSNMLLLFKSWPMLVESAGTMRR